MKKLIKNIKNYEFKPSDKFLLDTNIWMFLYGQQSQKSNIRTENYLAAFGNLISAKSHIYIDSLILSEFINRYARIEQQTSGYNDFKKFRNSAKFKIVAENIADTVKIILKRCIRIESGFELLDIDDLINEYKIGNSDFNDQVLARLCKSKGLILITDDGDFNNQNISLLTANKKLLGLA